MNPSPTFYKPIPMNERKNSVAELQSRVIAFFDAVVAIAITVMALEITIPAFKGISDDDKEEFLSMLTGYIISFVAISFVWYNHAHYLLVFPFTGRLSETVLHFLLMFIITLAQPTTRALGHFRDDLGVRLSYILVFILMLVFNILTMIILWYNNKKQDAITEAARIYIKDMLQTLPDQLSDHDKLVLDIVYHTHHPDSFTARFHDYIPDDMHKALELLRKKRREEIRNAVILTAVVAVFLIPAEITLMFGFPTSFSPLELSVFSYLCSSCRDSPLNLRIKMSKSKLSLNCGLLFISLPCFLFFVFCFLFFVFCFPFWFCLFSLV